MPAQFSGIVMFVQAFFCAKLSAVISLINTMFDKAKDLYKLQKQARKIKKDLKNTHIEAEEDGVTVTINGEQKLISVNISDEAMQDKSSLQEKLVKAFNKAIEKSQQIGASMMKEVMGDMNFPGLGG